MEVNRRQTLTVETPAPNVYEVMSTEFIAERASRGAEAEVFAQAAIWLHNNQDRTVLGTNVFYDFDENRIVLVLFTE